MYEGTKITGSSFLIKTSNEYRVLSTILELDVDLLCFFFAVAAPIIMPAGPNSKLPTTALLTIEVPEIVTLPLVTIVVTKRFVSDCTLISK